MGALMESGTTRCMESGTESPDADGSPSKRDKLLAILLQKVQHGIRHKKRAQQGGMYSTKEYWDERHGAGWDGRKALGYGTTEWYVGYQQLKPLLDRHIDTRSSVL